MVFLVDGYTKTKHGSETNFSIFFKIGVLNVEQLDEKPIRQNVFFQKLHY